MRQDVQKIILQIRRRWKKRKTKVISILLAIIWLAVMVVLLTNWRMFGRTANGDSIKRIVAVGTSLAVWCCGSNSMAVLLPLSQKKEENQTARGWKHRGTGDCNGDRNVLDHGVDL